MVNLLAAIQLPTQLQALSAPNGVPGRCRTMIDPKVDMVSIARS
jgi:hypothetical protein